VRHVLFGAVLMAIAPFAASAQTAFVSDGAAAANRTTNVGTNGQAPPSTAVGNAPTGPVISGAAPFMRFSGDAGTAMVRPMGGTIARPLATKLGDTLSVKDFGAVMNGSVMDEAALQAAYDATPDGGTIHVPSGNWPVGFRVKGNPSKRVRWLLDGNLNTGANPLSSQNNTIVRALSTTDDIVEGHNAGFAQYQKIIDTNNISNPLMFLQTELKGNQTGMVEGPLYTQFTNLSNFCVIDAGSTGALICNQNHLTSFGNNFYYAQDVANFNVVDTFGTNATWSVYAEQTDHSGENAYTYQDTTAGNGRVIPAGTLKAFQHVLAEMDHRENGPDEAGATYDPNTGTRVNFWLNNAAYDPGVPAPGQSYNVGQIVQQPCATNNVIYIWRVTTAGTAASPTPPFTCSNSKPIGSTFKDGTVVFTAINTFYNQVGRGIWFNSSDASTWGTAIGGTANIDNAFMDLSKVHFTQAQSAAIRIPASAVIDLSGNGTAAGRNQHTLTWSNYQGGSSLVYTAAGRHLLTIADNGATTLVGRTTIGSGGQANLAGISTGLPPVGLTVGHDATGGSETDFLVGRNGVQIFPVQPGGTRQAAPVATIDGTGNQTLQGGMTAAYTQMTATAVDGLPACTAELGGQVRLIDDGRNIAWHAAATGGATRTPGSMSHVLCNGAQWIYE
jgi:hypothetical protein